MYSDTKKSKMVHHHRYKLTYDYSNSVYICDDHSNIYDES